ncbi:MAG TPA: hypothetical protein VHC21_00200 [Candidatus Saccharimonadales bacterium]|nr:hypothetical protein [Candidatus Saccharimonadales bacterium]
MSVSQFSVSKRFAPLLALAVLALMVLGTVSRAAAESTVISHRQTNVFFTCNIDSEPGEPYRPICMRAIYQHGGFKYTRSSNYGSLFYNEKEAVVGFKLALVSGEKIVQIETTYSYANNRGQIHFKWNGRGTLPLQRSYKGTEVHLNFVNVGVHSPKLPDQPKQPEHTGMR